MRYVLAVLGLLTCLADSANAACWGSAWFGAWGSVSTYQWRTDGRPCRFTLTAAGTSEMRSMSIVERPRHGAASASRYSVIYRPKAGFKGEDSFAFAVAGALNGSPVRATVRVMVTVQ